MGQLIHQNKPRPARQRTVQIKLTQVQALIFQLPAGQLFQPVQKGQRFRALVTLHIARHYVHTILLGAVGCSEHGISFAHTG